MALETMPVPIFVAVTVTPGINARETSDTVPPNVAFVVWGKAFVNKTGSSTNATAKILFISPPTPIWLNAS